ncbi:hypothetical protein [Burkholderia gladioli]|uniref:hypothetical protein n=1 Tax=Burkholderia gladioli TaxID=28095 RepID=UPI00163EFC28|nr:hypothetical protein [Burkholderia gladioli]
MANHKGSGPAWPEEEERLLREHWANPAPIKTFAHLFPKRTIGAIERHAHDMGLPSRRALRREFSAQTTMARIKACMQEKPGTVADLAERAIVSKHTVRRFISDFRSDIYVRRYAPRSASGYRAAVWAVGKRPDAPKPAPEPRGAAAARYYRRKAKDPVWMADMAARLRKSYARKRGTKIRRDAAAIALFGKPGEVATTS